MKNIRKGRLIFLIAVTLCACTVFIIRLFQLQIIQGKDYYKKSVNTVVTTTEIKAPRGNILDRNCIPLVQDKQTLSVTVNRSFTDDLNKEIMTLINIFKTCDEQYIDTFPLKYSGDDFYLDDSIDDSSIKSAFETFLKNKKINSELSPSEIAVKLIKSYSLTDYSYLDASKIMAVRYELEQRSVKNICTFAENISMKTATVIKEHGKDLNGVDIAEEPTRVYSYDYSCSHILGTVGRIYSDELEDLKSKGYQLDDTVGKSGIEKICESYLRGTNGSISTSSDSSGNVVDIIKKQNAVAGSDVILTIDETMQQIVENSLIDVVDKVRALNGEKSATSASVVIMDPNNGDVLSMANYPTYNLHTFYQDYSVLSKDSSHPYLNRAIAGLYPPGSTFKMVTASAGLETKAINSSTVYVCKGRYTYYPDYQPTCFNSIAHGRVTVVEALQKSCNGFFFDTARLTGVANIDKYAALYGFGSKSGIELTGEADGIVAGPEYRQTQGGTWNSGDTLLSGIGQSDTVVTPLQLAVYASTIANGGTRYTPHIIKSIRNSETGEVQLESKPEGEKTGISASTMSLIQTGMFYCANRQGGSAYSSFRDYNLTTVCTKTGTAEYANELPTAVLVGYAPAENPQIAFMIIVEHAGTGTTGYNASLIKEVLNYYFTDSRVTSSTTDNIVIE